MNGREFCGNRIDDEDASTNRFTLWTGRAFCGTWADDEPDAEYTWYALLAMGHLSLA